MKTKISNELCHLFENYNYQQLPTDSEKVKMYGTFHGGCLYLINVIQLDDDYAYNNERFAHYKEITKKQFGHVNASKMILLNLMITNKPMAVYEAINYMPNFDDELIDIQWLIDEDKEQLIIPSEQVKHALGLEKDIPKLLKNKVEDPIHHKTKVKKDHQIPYLTYGLILINVFFWIVLELSGGSTNLNTLLRFGAINSNTFFSGNEYYKLITSMFLHIGAAHLLYNTFGLYIFGSRLEVYMKPWQFLTTYIGAGIVGGLLSVGIHHVTDQLVVAAGASGAIYGVMGALLVYSWVYRRQFDGLSTYTILLMLVIGIAMGAVTPGVGNLAHLGGFIGGAIITYLLTRLKIA